MTTRKSDTTIICVDQGSGLAFGGCALDQNIVKLYVRQSVNWPTPYSEPIIAVSTVDHKLAALYFDSIFPCTAYDEVPQDIRIDADAVRGNYVKHGTNITDQACLSMRSLNMESGVEDWDHGTLWTANDRAFDAFDALRRQGRLAVSVFHPDHPWEDYLRHFCSGEIRYYLVVRLRGLRPIDTSRAPWEQISKVKQDKDASCRLRRFRLFAYENFYGKSRSYVADRLDEKTDEYEQTCRTQGFELIDSTVSLLLDPTSFPDISGMIAASVLAGDSVTASGEAVIETSKLVINVVATGMGRLTYKNNHELAYLFELQDSTRLPRNAT